MSDYRCCVVTVTVFHCIWKVYISYKLNVDNYIDLPALSAFLINSEPRKPIKAMKLLIVLIEEVSFSLI